jgi:hypothetical protein
MFCYHTPVVGHFGDRRSLTRSVSFVASGPTTDPRNLTVRALCCAARSQTVSERPRRLRANASPSPTRNAADMPR